ncbi:MAG TPA: hypothetical protein VFP05_10770 [Thermomicrobiales bacterium]|nr:hypothetical protein [Thermomicrobiales bacterium]
MSRHPLLKIFFALAVMLTLVSGVALPVSAQGDDTSLEEGTPPPDLGNEPQYGLLQVSAVSCTGGDAGTVSILLAEEYVPPGDCIDGSSALLIDGVDYGAVAPYLEIQLEAGTHSLSEQNSGASRDVDIFADSTTAVVIVTVTAAAEPTTETAVEPAAAATSGLTIVAHSCKPDVQSVDQLYGLGGLTDRLNACPAFTLPGYPSPGGTASGGEQTFDFTLAPASGDPQTLPGNGAFISDAFCESTVGALDDDPTNDRCVSNAGFAFELPEGEITLTQTLIPDTMRYVAAEAGSDADGGIITGSDPGSGYLGIDTSLRGTDQPTIHLFYLNPPRVNVVVHLCGADITSPNDLTALGSLAAQLLTCPATARTAEGGVADFGLTVTDNNWGGRGLDSATFDPTVICESDIGEWTGDSNDNACVDAPTYRFDQTAQGYVTVTQDYAPDGYSFGGANSADGAVASVDPSGVVALDTSADGDVTVHLFDILAAPEATATSTSTPTPTKTAAPPTPTKSPTSTPTVPAATRTATPPGATSTATEPTGSTTGLGTVTIAALYCLSGSGTTIVALAPGEQASADDLGGSSCFAGDATIQLSLADGTALSGLKLGRDGVESIQNIPVTTSGTHTITEGLTGHSASFEIETETVTRVIVRFGAGTSMVDEGVSSAGGAPGSTTGPGGADATGGLVTDELIGDAGVSSSAGSYDGISFTSLLAEDVDAQKVSSVKDAKSLPAVGVIPMKPVQQYLTLAAGLALLLASVAFTARRSTRRTR